MSSFLIYYTMVYFRLYYKTMLYCGIYIYIVSYKYDGILSKRLGIIIIHSGHTTPVFVQAGWWTESGGSGVPWGAAGQEKTYRILNLNQMK